MEIAGLMGTGSAEFHKIARNSMYFYDIIPVKN